MKLSTTLLLTLLVTLLSSGVVGARGGGNWVAPLDDKTVAKIGHMNPQERQVLMEDVAGKLAKMTAERRNAFRATTGVPVDVVVSEVRSGNAQLAQFGNRKGRSTRISRSDEVDPFRPVVPSEWGIEVNFNKTRIFVALIRCGNAVVLVAMCDCVPSPPPTVIQNHRGRTFLYLQ